ncbi:MAG: DNA adenine methylase [Caldilineaceae bacterium SB0666_bin_21]|nr:DNA adenine methylase [Caldilineaceae bacterium SB0666_bin_21]
MPYYSPLRYPGSKRRLAPFISQLLEVNCLSNGPYVEPFAGGASLALELLFKQRVAEVYLNDLSRPIYAFWHTILNDTKNFCHRIVSTAITMEEWRRQKATFEAGVTNTDVPLSDLGFAAFFLNRTNRSGILSGGVIGGHEQSGSWTLDIRFNKKDLIHRIQQISHFRDRIHVYNQDGISFIEQKLESLDKRAFIFFDPPYIDKGNGLYLNLYRIEDHKRLERQIGLLEQPWIVTYDYQGATRNQLYQNSKGMKFELSYSAQSRRKGMEAMFLSPNLKLPKACLLNQSFPYLVSVSN